MSGTGFYTWGFGAYARAELYGRLSDSGRLGYRYVVTESYGYGGPYEDKGHVTLTRAPDGTLTGTTRAGEAIRWVPR